MDEFRCGIELVVSKAVAPNNVEELQGWQQEMVRLIHKFT
jgi:hypothetical protein